MLLLLLLLLHTTKMNLNKKKTTYNKRLATKIVAGWELKVVVSRTAPIRIAFDQREQRTQTAEVNGESLCLLVPSVFWNTGGLGEFGMYLIGLELGVVLAESEQKRPRITTQSRARRHKSLSANVQLDPLRSAPGLRLTHAPPRCLTRIQSCKLAPKQLTSQIPNTRPDRKYRRLGDK